MRKAKKDQWKLAATMFEKSATGSGLMLVGAALTGNITKRWTVVIMVILILVFVYAGLVCAGQGDTNERKKDGDRHGA